MKTKHLLNVMLIFAAFLSAGSTAMAQVANPPDVEWLHRIGGSGYDDTFGMAVDQTDIYVVTRRDDDGVVVKLNGDGEALWESVLSIRERTEPFDVAVHDGVAYVAGRTDDQTGSVGFVAVFSSEGQIVDVYSDFQYMREIFTIEVDATGIYVAGDDFFEPVVSRLDLDGNELWTRRPGGNGSGQASALENGLFHVSSFSFDRALLAFDVDGNIVNQFPTEIGTGANGLAVSQGISFLAGYVYAFGDTIASIDASGNERWSRPFFRPYGRVEAAKVDGGSLYVGGSYELEAPHGPVHALVVRYDLDGNLEWSREFGVTGWVMDVEVDANGDLIVVGNTIGDIAGMPVEGGLDVFVAKVRVHPAGTFPSLRGEARAGGDWTRIPASGEFNYPTFFIGTPTFNGREPGVARMRNGSSSGFDLRFQEWEYLQAANPENDGHRAEEMSYLVLDPGRHYLEDGSIWEVGSFIQKGTPNWTRHYFSQPFPAKPHVFMSVQTANGRDAVTVRTRSVNSNSFDAALFEQEGFMDGHTNERIAFLAIYSRQAGGAISLGNELASYSLESTGLDHHWADSFGTAFKLEEEQSRDAEVWHTMERVDILKIHQQIFGHIVSQKGKDTVALRRR